MGREGGALALLAGLFLLCGWERRKLQCLPGAVGRRVAAPLLLALALISSVALSACGGGPRNYVPAPESYTILVSAKSGSVTEFCQITLLIP